MIHKQHCDLLIASCEAEGGIFKYRLTADGELEQIGKIPMPSPMFFEVKDGVIWVVLRAPFDGISDSGIAAFDLCTGKRLTETVPTMGDVGCHIAVDGSDVYCANYIRGSVFKSPDVLRAHTGHGTDKVRQEAPHVHSVFFSPDKKYVLSCDLGLDTVYVYDRELNLISEACVPDGSGARHIAFSKDGEYVYCINEMAATVSVFAYSDGRLTYIRDVNAKPEGFAGQGKGAAIKLNRDGDKIYVTERGSESISVFAVDGEKLTLLDTVSSHGREPRDFTLFDDGKMAACANQFSDNVSIYGVDENGKLNFKKSFFLPAPICVSAL